MSLDEPFRPDPDALLAEAAKAGRGRLKVFLGMAPGVGKTYEMLSQAGRRQAEGGQVLVGVVETHGRRETEALLEGLEVLPRKPMEHRGRVFLEFDIDAALARRPTLLLIDEYAHTNAPGSRHPKRWQDVDEVLASGIDVWTTLNVQHLESLVDVVWKITGVRVRETVPDQVLSNAEEIELVDLTPEALRKRLSEGRVYVPETARLAADKFFKPENLTALRELALRRAAQTIDDQLVGAMRRSGIEGPWAAGERILVLVAGDAMAASLVRAGRRLADLMDAPWTVAHVERPSQPTPSGLAATRLSEALKLTEQLGGSTLMLTGDDLPSAILGYARRNNVTQIVLGKAKAPLWRVATGRSLGHVLLQKSGGSAVHFVSEGAPEPAEAAAPRKPPGWKAWTGYGAAVLLVAIACGVSAVLDRMSAGSNLAMIFLAAVLVSGLAFGLGASLLAAALAIAAYNFFFLEPRFSFVIGHAHDVLTFVIFLAVAGATGGLAGRVRDQGVLSKSRAAAVTALLAASRRLSSAPTLEATAQALAEQIAGATGGVAAVLLPRGEDLVEAAASPDPPVFSTAAMAAARWAWEKREPAGAGTGTLPQAGWTFRPLVGVRAPVGVAAIEALPGAAGEDGRLINALIDQGALALERAQLAAATVENETLRRSDRLRSALLNSISHDLRTPLSTVLGAATTLIDYRASLKSEVQDDLLQSIREEAERLNRYVGDLLDITRLEGGALVTRKSLIDARDVLGLASDRVRRRLGGRRLVQDFPDQLSMIRADPALLEQSLVNILENAIAYSPEGSTIETAAF
ncbi:MAG TPA: sensor histidine kinase KdpD, partial [Caulobacteraceae bacterium]|nr:sensor histidine kinase KdpD [Caulobacteraceae bacterium]